MCGIASAHPSSHTSPLLGLVENNLTRHEPGTGIGRSCRYKVERETPRAWATSTMGAPSVIIFMACLRFTGVSAVGRPPRRPRARAAASPAWVRSRIRSRSNVPELRAQGWCRVQRQTPPRFAAPGLQPLLVIGLFRFGFRAVRARLERRGERVQPVPFVAQGVGGGVEDAAHIRSRSTRYPGATDIEPEWTRVAVADPTRVSGGSPPAVRPVLWLQQYLRVTLCNCLQTQGDERPSTLSGGSVTEGCVLGQC